MTQRPYVPMTERDRQALRIAQAEIAAEEARAEEERLRPIKEAEQQLNQTFRELRKLELESVTSGKDSAFVKDEETKRRTVPNLEAAKAFNVAQYKMFADRNPDYWPTPENFKVIGEYLDRQGINLASAANFEAAYRRCAEFELLQERPAPEPEPVPEPVIVAPIEEKPTEETYQGFDLETGEPRAYSRWEVEHLTADQFKRAMRITKADQTLCRRTW